MLSRIAESLFWIGRYVERAEDTARILDVHIHHLLEAPLKSENEMCRSLLAVMGVTLPAEAIESVTPRRVTEILAFDRGNPSSIVSSLTAARVNARSVSEAISSEMWEALNVTYNALPTGIDIASRTAPYAFFRFVRERAALIAGLSESTMSRDDAWRFMVLGRSLERVDMITRLVSSAVSGPEPDWTVLLRSCSAHEAFLRTYRREPEPRLAAEFLLLDRLFPRSVFYSLQLGEDCLAELDPRSGRAGMSDEARLIPLTTPTQLVLDARVQVQPATNMFGYVDYWGTVVQAFDLEKPHSEMVITGRSVVETTLSAVERDPDVGWAELAEGTVRDLFSEFLAPTGNVPADPRLAEVAAQLTQGAPSPREAAARAVGWVNDQLTYVPGATGVHTSAIEAWDGGEGVCQDFAHLSLAVLRTMGIPSRYCSGYAHPLGDADVGQTVRGESHAWVEYWSGDWTAVDPTAGREVGERHVLVARGRDYSDVPPVKGLFHGGPTSDLEVAVSLTRLA